MNVVPSKLITWDLSYVVLMKSENVKEWIIRSYDYSRRVKEGSKAQ